ncbi:uncharacterized protein LY79DRAFT_121023 [Colletotrichum navitas]|uniref:Uncharacterized protein n=1 Tax=Colletotrichum navitas TaxID=681940 RepID=A0AAD8UYC2_9PEZI|nr:uncharacterized protein LY79DRAFT_121023 [Colletotrichum navitas]KAK1565910.1 hypothetical protein LY79DRAFT_121023 [Colletotrichum navitas]
MVSAKIFAAAVLVASALALPTPTDSGVSSHGLAARAYLVQYPEEDNAAKVNKRAYLVQYPEEDNAAKVNKRAYLVQYPEEDNAAKVNKRAYLVQYPEEDNASQAATLQESE